MHVAVVSTFYPNSAEPLRAIFVRNLVAALEAHVAVTVVSPVPYAPPLPRLPRWSALRAIPHRASEGARTILHPRFIVVPKSESINGVNYFCGVLNVLRRLVRSGGVNLLHVHCAYPDAVGTALAASFLNVPFVVTAHGSDINVYARKPSIRRQQRWALGRAGAVIAVSKEIQRSVRDLIPQCRDRVIHIPCAGVDRRVFAPRDRAAARLQLGVAPKSRLIVFAGQLVRVKALDVLLDAWRILMKDQQLRSDDRLAIIGDGPLRAQLERSVTAASLQGMVQFTGEMPQEKLAQWFNAATLFCLPSRSEGTPNVIVEALASGCPVVASNVGGIPDLISDRSNGMLCAPGDSQALAATLATAFDHPWNPTTIAATAAQYTWELIAERNYAVFKQVMADRSQVSNALLE